MPLLPEMTDHPIEAFAMRLSVSDPTPVLSLNSEHALLYVDQGEHIALLALSPETLTS
jgi:hypothetical protein